MSTTAQGNAAKSPSIEPASNPSSPVSPKLLTSSSSIRLAKNLTNEQVIGVPSNDETQVNTIKKYQIKTTNPIETREPRSVVSGIGALNYSPGTANMQQQQPQFNPYEMEQEQANRLQSSGLNLMNSGAFSAFSKDKLKNLQEALAKHYTKDQLKQLGIIVNKTATAAAAQNVPNPTADAYKYQDYKYYGSYQDRPAASDNYKTKQANNNSNHFQSNSKSAQGGGYHNTSNYFTYKDAAGESNMLSAVAAAAVAVNKTSPQLFSKYIESVHKAMHGGAQEASTRDGSVSSSSNLGDKGNEEHAKFVEQCRHMFQQQEASKRAEDYYAARNNSSSAFFYSTYTPPKAASSSSLLSYSMLNNKNSMPPVGVNESGRVIPHLSSIRASSLDYNNQKSSSTRLPDVGMTHQPRAMSHFNHLNRASYKGECKRLMSRGNMETVAERAARFEEIDLERYNRLKAKYGELDLSQQYQHELANQIHLNRYLKSNDYVTHSNTSVNHSYLDSMEIKKLPPPPSKPRQLYSGLIESLLVKLDILNLILLLFWVGGKKALRQWVKQKKAASTHTRTIIRRTTASTRLVKWWTRWWVTI